MNKPTALLFFLAFAAVAVGEDTYRGPPTVVVDGVTFYRCSSFGTDRYSREPCGNMANTKSPTKPAASDAASRPAGHDADGAARLIATERRPDVGVSAAREDQTAGQDSAAYEKAPTLIPFKTLGVVTLGVLFVAWLLVRYRRTRVPAAGGVTGPQTGVAKDRKAAIDQYVEAHGKSYATGFILALLFGPIGLLYSSVLGGLILLLAGVALASSMGPGVGLILWLLSIVLSFQGVSDANKRAKATARLLARGLE